MPLPAAIDIMRVDLFSDRADLERKYPPAVVERVLRVRELYNYALANPSKKDREIIADHLLKYPINKSCAYADWALARQLLPMLTSSSRAYHRWKYNEMILETYNKAKARKDAKTMERAASSYAKYNRVDVDDDQRLPYDMIVVQPFTATDDPSVLGIKPIPNVEDKIKKMLEKYRAESIDIDDVEFEEADLEEDVLYGESEKTDILQ